MTSSLVQENNRESCKDQELPSNYLVGSYTSSMHRLRDTDDIEGGFFVFGDLSVKREGRFRLRFTLYERDQHSSTPSFYFVSELITNVFTVFPTKLFPGIVKSTPLTRTFGNQGVKVRLRKYSSGMAARKRSRSIADASDNYFEQQPKRSSYDREDAPGHHAGPSFRLHSGIDMESDGLRIGWWPHHQDDFGICRAFPFGKGVDITS
jgi:hypothetical protein